MQVLKTDVEAALKVLNFAIYHKELIDMEEREEREREMEMKRKADSDAANNDENIGGGGRWISLVEWFVLAFIYVLHINPCNPLSHSLVNL